MILDIEVELVYSFGEPTEIIALIQASKSTDQLILAEKLEIAPPTELLVDVNLEGDRRIRTTVDGQVKVTYAATVDNMVRSLLPASGRQLPWSELPEYVLQYLLPSRYCPSDKFQRFVLREFSNAGDGVAKVTASLDWITRNVDYVHGVSTPETTAERTFIDRAGVCRDFTHLGITFCRAMSIPARAVSAYALDLEPPDFHAIFEVYLDGAWWVVDPTRLAAPGGIVRIGSGRDAADISFLTTAKPCQLVRQSVSVQSPG